MRRKGIILCFVIGGGIIFFFRYLFLLTVGGEERTTGGIYEPMRILDIDIKDDGISYKAVTAENKDTKKVGPITFLFQEWYPLTKAKVKENEFPFLFFFYIGPLYIYIPRIVISLFGENLFSVRLCPFLTFLIFLSLYLYFTTRYYGFREGVLSSLFLITFPLFSARFLTMCFWNETVVFVMALLIVIRIRKMFERLSLRPSDIFLISFWGGFMLHFHLLAGGALFSSFLLSFFLCARKKFQISKTCLLYLIPGVIIITIFLLPFSLFLFKEAKGSFYAFKLPLSSVVFLTGPLRTLLFYLIGTFAPSNFYHFGLYGDPGWQYLFFSLLPGLLIAFTIYILVVRKMKESGFERFISLSVMLYVVFSCFGNIKPYHFNYILIFIPPYIVSLFPSSFKFISQKVGNILIIISIFCNLFECELLREDIKNSSLSLSVHREVVRYLEDNGINRIYDFAGRFGYQFISKKKIEVVEMVLYLKSTHNPKRIALSLLFSKGGIIMVEKYKKIGWTTGISLEEVEDIGRRIGLKIIPLKRFPEEGEALIWLARVE